MPQVGPPRQRLLVFDFVEAVLRAQCVDFKVGQTVGVGAQRRQQFAAVAMSRIDQVLARVGGTSRLTVVSLIDSSNARRRKCRAMWRVRRKPAKNSLSVSFMAVAPMVSRETVKQVQPRLVHRKTGTARLGAPGRKDWRVDRVAMTTLKVETTLFSVDEKDVGT